MNDPGMVHAPHCLRLVIVVTKGYTVTVNRCDECGAITTERHGAEVTPSDTGHPMRRPGPDTKPRPAGAGN